MIALAIAFSAGSFLYRLLRHTHLGQSSAMFLGVPAVLAILVALTPKARTVTGGIVKGITLALLIIAPLLGEGYLCILFAAPLFYIVGIVIGLLVDWLRARRSTTLGCVAIVLLPLCLEGVVPELTFDREQSVTVSRVVPASAADVEASLSLSPRIDQPLPRYLAIGFPRPLYAQGSGLDEGATRTIHFSGAEGDPPGDLMMRVTGRDRSSVRFETVSDASKLTQWLRWESSDVSWMPINAGSTLVTWKVTFARQLDPAWYFVPWERLTVGEAARYLIAVNAEPATSMPTGMTK
ncbi:hypothetical protein HDF16_001831 [Granulicella aggregans]|uniref:Uncharacterized protein n=1 Tax=Granulicella aggregans TaxID=474949 RepID=A0A7W7ZD54_9BACT|nr:hypothetical protein [Granulicella aggregans]MBB5057146.1 hypothetical protein [Granulicella aggregans]